MSAQTPVKAAPADANAAQQQQVRYISNSMAATNPRKLEMPLSIGHGAVVHHRVRLLATNGPIYIGEYTVVDDEAEIENKLPLDAQGKPQTLHIGNATHIGARAVINSLSVGDGVLVRAYARLGIMSRIGDHCVIQAKARVTHDAVVPNGTMVSGEGSEWSAREHYDPEDDMEEVRAFSRFFRKHLKP